MNEDEDSYGCGSQRDDTVDNETFSTECPHCGASSWFCDCTNDEADADTENTSLFASDLGQPTHGATQADQEQAHQDPQMDREHLGSKFIFESFGMAGHLSGEPEVAQPRRCPHPECLGSLKTYTKKKFDLHNRWQHKKERKCRVCGYECVKKTDFERHYFKHLPPEEQEKRRIDCKIGQCKRKFTLAYNLERHLCNLHKMSKEQAKKVVNERQ